MEKSVEKALYLMQEQFASLKEAFKRVADVADESNASGLLFACHMLQQSFEVYETELVRFLHKEMGD